MLPKYTPEPYCWLCLGAVTNCCLTPKCGALFVAAAFVGSSSGCFRINVPNAGACGNFNTTDVIPGLFMPRWQCGSDYVLNLFGANGLETPVFNPMRP